MSAIAAMAPIAALFALVGLGTYALVRKPNLGLAIVLASFIASAALRDAVPLEVAFGSFTVRAADVIAALLFVIGVVRLFTAPPARPVVIAVGALSALVLVHLARGVSVFGVEAAVNAGRAWIYFVGAFVFAISAPRLWNRRSLALFAAGGALVAALGLIEVAETGVRRAGEYIASGHQLVDARPVTAAGALAVFTALVIVVSAPIMNRPLRICVAGVSVPALLLIHHRTIWIAAAAALAIAFFVWSRSTLPRSRETVFGATGLMLIVLPLLLWLPTRSETFRASVAEVSGSSTISWRTESWEALVRERTSLRDAFLGSPSGTSWQRVLGDGTATDLAPHSLYVESYLRFGIPGLALIGLIASLAVWSVRSRRSALPQFALVAILIGQFTFGLTYQLELLSGLLLGLVCQPLALDRRASLRATRPATEGYRWQPAST